HERAQSLVQSVAEDHNGLVEAAGCGANLSASALENRGHVCFADFLDAAESVSAHFAPGGNVFHKAGIGGRNAQFITFHKLVHLSFKAHDGAGALQSAGVRFHSASSGGGSLDTFFFVHLVVLVDEV